MSNPGLHAVLNPQRLLRRRLQTLAPTQVELARRLGVDPTQLNRWLNGTEKIPLNHLTQLDLLAANSCEPAASDLTGIGFVDSFLISQVLGSDDRRSNNARTLLAIICQLEEEAALPKQAVSKPYLDALNDLVHRDLPGSHAATLVRSHVASAVMMSRIVLDGFRTSGTLIEERLLEVHLRYPSNILLGTLMQALANTQVGSWMLNTLRTGAQASTTEPRDALLRAHCRHLLSRYGSADDRAHMLNLSVQRGIKVDALTRKLSFSGRILAGGDEEVAAEFVHDLLKDEELLDAHVRFDLFHYGDLRCSAADILRAPVAGARSTAIQSCRHLSGQRGYSALAGPTVLKLSHLAKCLPAPFRFTEPQRQSLREDASLVSKLEGLQGQAPKRNWVLQFLELVETK